MKPFWSVASPTSKAIRRALHPRRGRAFAGRGCLLKAPITTPLGGGYKSLNVTIRKSLNMYANVRPTKSYAPYVASLHPGMDLVIVRENEEDLYAGIEHQQTPEVAQVLKLVTYPVRSASFATPSSTPVPTAVARSPA